MRLALHLPNHGSAVRAIALARAADRAGIRDLWVAEDLFYRGAVPIAAAALASTEHARIGFGVLTPYVKHPVSIAMDLVALQDLAPGRVVFGLGAGVQARIARIGATWSNPLDAVRETVSAVERLLAGESLDGSAGLFAADALSLTISDRPAMPPVYVAAVGPKALAQAGERYDGVLLTIMTAPSYVAWAAEHVASGVERRAPGAAPVDIVASIPVRVDADPQAARAQARELVGAFMTRWRDIPSLRAMFTTRGVLDDDAFDALVDRIAAGERAADVVPDEVALAYCAAGTPAEVAAQLHSWRDAGATTISIELDDGLPEDAVETLLRDLLRESA